MNVVFLPALVSSLLAVTDSLPCLEGPCVFGYLWTLAALTLLSAWFVRRWPEGNDLARQLQPVGASVTANLPQPTQLTPQTRQSPARPRAVLAAAGLALRAPPTTDMADPAAPTLRTPRSANVAVPDGSFPSRQPDPVSPGTPTAPDVSSSSGRPGQLPPA
jgi:hypothetical protein